MTSKASTPDSEISAPEDNCYRLVVLGSPKVGKTAIVSRFLTGKFDDGYTPTIEDFHRKIYKIKGQVYQLDILDTSGNNPFPAIHKLSILTAFGVHQRHIDSYYPTPLNVHLEITCSDVFIIVYSIDDRNSFQEAIRLREQIQATKTTANGTKSPPMVIAGNKCDKDNNRQVPMDEAKAAFDQTRRCNFLETSAKKFYNVDVLFRCLFENARLPSEMSPSLHRKVSASHGPTSLRPTHIGKLALRRRLSEACGMVTPNARRPSVRSDLLQLRLKTLRGSSMDEVDDEDSERSSIHRKLRKAMCCIQ